MQDTPEPPISTTRDPQPSVERIENLAQRVLSGDIVLPAFQRDFVWKTDQVLNLLDSIVRNYPIGSVLLWLSKQKLRNENTIAGLEASFPPPEYPVNYLLDGQQRLSTICGAMFWRGQDPNSPWNIAYDLRFRRFVHLESLDEPYSHYIRANKLSDPVAYFQQVSSIQTSSARDKEQLVETANLLFKRFKDYKIAVVTLADMPIRVVGPIFERINSTGTRLTIVDLMRAATWSEEFDLFDAIDEVTNALAAKKFDDIERKAVLRSISAAAGGEFHAESIDTLRDRTPIQLKAASSAVKDAYSLAIDFLASDLGVPGEGALPYVNQIVVLSEIFRRNPRPSPEQRKEIIHWFWRTTATNYFGGWNTGMMVEDLKRVADFANGVAGRLQDGFGTTNAQVWRSRGFRSNSVQSKLLALILSQSAPRDLLTGQRVDIGQAIAQGNFKEFHHVFPVAYLGGDRRNFPANSLANIAYTTSASNKVISSSQPSVYLSKARAELGGEFDIVMESNLLNAVCVEAAMRDDFTAFVEARAQHIHQKLATLAGWE